MDPITILTSILSANNIAITVLAIIVAFLSKQNNYLLREHFQTSKELKETMIDLQKTLVILSERINRHDH